MDIREVIHQKDKEGLQPLVDEIIKRSEETLKGDEREQEIMQQMRTALGSILADSDVSVSRSRLKGMLRYLAEKGQYEPDMVQLHHLTDTGLLKKGDELVDLGAGPGFVVDRWAHSNKKNAAVGVDISPSFVADSDLLKLGLIDGDTLALSALIGEQRRDTRTVLSSLTLDRVGRPRRLLDNVFKLAGKKGNFAVGSLFPIVPVDDEKVDTSLQIVYTPQHERIASAGTEQGDLRQILEYIEDVSQRKVKHANLKYNVKTNSGEQPYTNYHIITNAE